jgi:hypothetical protein
VCCSITHGAACPIDVVKTRIQLDPVTYNQGLIGGFRQVIAAEGAGALATGLVPTAGGYFVQGWFKFGGFEFFKVGTQPCPRPPPPTKTEPRCRGPDHPSLSCSLAFAR